MNSPAPARVCGPAILLALLWALLPPASGGEAPDAEARRAEARKALAAASRLAAEGTPEEALKSADRAVTLDPMNELAHRFYQDLMLAAGRRAELAARYARARGKRKNKRLLAVIAYMEARAQADPKERRRELESIYGARTSHFWAAYDLVAACVECGDLEAAEKYALAARELRPRDADVRNVLGNVLLQAGKLDEAEKELGEALRLRTPFAAASYNLGLVAAARKKYADAVEHFRRALAADPKMAEAAGNMGHCLARLEKPDEAIAAYRKAISIRPGYGQAHNNLAVALYRKKDYWGAWKHLQEAEKCGYVPAESFKRVLRKQLFPDEKPAPPSR